MLHSFCGTGYRCRRLATVNGDPPSTPHISDSTRSATTVRRKLRVLVKDHSYPPAKAHKAASTFSSGLTSEDICSTLLPVLCTPTALCNSTRPMEAAEIRGQYCGVSVKLLKAERSSEYATHHVCRHRVIEGRRAITEVPSGAPERGRRGTTTDFERCSRCKLELTQLYFHCLCRGLVIHAVTVSAFVNREGV